MRIGSKIREDAREILEKLSRSGSYNVTVEYDPMDLNRDGKVDTRDAVMLLMRVDERQSD